MVGAGGLAEAMVEGVVVGGSVSFACFQVYPLPVAGELLEGCIDVVFAGYYC